MYLSINEIKQLIFSNFPNEKADIVSKHLEHKCFMNNDKLYTLTPNISYEVTTGTKVENKLLNTVTKLLQQSYDKLDDLGKTEISNIKKWATVFNNRDVKTYYPQLQQTIMKDQTVDDYYDEIHFANGVYYLDRAEFKPRKIGKHFITYYIDYDYVRPSKKALNYVKSVVKKTFPLVEDYECICTIFGAVLTGRSGEDQTMLFLLGDASSGKSNLLSMTELAVQKYCVQLKDNTFAANASTADKVYNTFSNGLYIRFAWVNEMKDTKCDPSVFKQFNDGKLQTVKLFKDGCESFEHRAKLFSTANNLPNILIDNGTLRRIKAYLTEAKFVEHEHEVDEDNHVYLKDKNLLQDMKEKNLRVAWFQIMADFAYDWLESRVIHYPPNFDSAKCEIAAANDIMQDFIDGHLIATGNEADRVGKLAMHDAFKVAYPEKHLSPIQLITSLKEKKLNYNCKLRAAGIQGCFTGVMLREDGDLFERDDDDDAHNADIDKSEKAVDIRVEYSKLKHAYESLVKKYNNTLRSGFGKITNESDSESDSEDESDESEADSDSDSEDEAPPAKEPAKKAKCS
jgi:hypothetical protein